MISQSEIREFLELSPFQQVGYLCHCIKCWTSVPRFYIAIKLVRLFHWLRLDWVGNWIGHISGLNKRLVQEFPDLASEEQRARYLN